MDIREQKQKSSKPSHTTTPAPSSTPSGESQLTDHDLNQMISRNLTRKLSIIDNLYYKYMNDHYQTHKDSYSKYIHSPLVAGYGIISTGVMLYLKKFKVMHLAANVCVLAVLNQMAIERKSMNQNKEMTEDYEESNRNYKELMRIKMKRVSLWDKVTSGLSAENISLYLQYRVK